MQDRFFEGMTRDFFMEQIRPKVHGGLALNDIMADRPLDFFVMLSSIGGMRGTHGQTPYAATSTFLDGFAHHLRERGVPASVVDIGVVSEIGYITYQSEERQKLIRGGHAGFSLNEKDIRSLVDAAMQVKFGVDGQKVQCVSGCIVDPEASGADAVPYSRAMFSHLRKLFSDVFQVDGASGQGQGANSAKSVRVRLAAARANTDPKILSEVTMDLLIEKLSNVMMIPREDIQPQKRLKDYGFDSLVSAEIRNWLAKDLEVNISMPVLLGFPSITALADRIVETSPLCTKG
jgi:acyl carrier protein